ncbi:hypothetical protein M4951_17390 [Blastopirellula sp. J2-11]|uniref:hypothetical protein n=1 Tax=Blastopirellula sp. J2-11 TaxID=2943192 RepID=UPI0021CAB7D5|nr:hypothetical protein [Blastopirellula sp. J2-11]UUO05149.1 hypothetical protein M4951_17390 [Blastopirellula sp. J2-11]
MLPPLNDTIAIILGNEINIALPEITNITRRYFCSADEAKTLLFYDWLEDQQGAVCGLTIHVDAASPFAANLTSRPYVTFDPFMKLWFTNQQTGTERGLEAFGDIDLIGMENNEYAVLVSTFWLNDGDREYLQDAFRRPTNL